MTLMSKNLIGKMAEPVRMKKRESIFFFLSNGKRILQNKT